MTLKLMTKKLARRIHDGILKIKQKSFSVEDVSFKLTIETIGKMESRKKDLLLKLDNHNRSNDFNRAPVRSAFNSILPLNKICIFFCVVIKL